MTPQDLMRKYEEALASQKWNNIEPLVHDNICVTFSTGTFKGKHEVQRAFERNFATIKDEEYSISNLDWVYLGKESALCLYNFQWQGLVDGRPSSGSGRGTSVLVNETGKWKILTEHLGPHAS
jgi:ketosteroid isomerase-like protein